MSFNKFSKHAQGVELLKRSLARGRLGHAYLFAGDRLEELEALARTLAKTLNCQNPVRQNGLAVDCCDECVNCLKTENETHPDIHWVRPESKSRVITVEQTRELMRAVQLKPAEAGFKVAVIAGADRLNPQAANAFLKTLEEPPQKSILILLSTTPQRILETILSRCLRLNFFSNRQELDPAQSEWLQKFCTLAYGGQKSLMGRYLLLDVLLQKLAGLRALVGEGVAARSPLEKYGDIEKDLREKWEDELAAAVESEYRRQRADLLLLVQFWLRDIWLLTLAAGSELLNYPKIAGTEEIAKRISTHEALENLRTFERAQRLLHTNVQEALALEVGLLKLHF
ncbi:MAG TPA: hypothetical protein VGI03_15490 [Verrucomicrobiae bacterium]